MTKLGSEMVWLHNSTIKQCCKLSIEYVTICDCDLLIGWFSAKEAAREKEEAGKGDQPKKVRIQIMLFENYICCQISVHRVLLEKHLTVNQQRSEMHEEIKYVDS